MKTADLIERCHTSGHISTSTLCNIYVHMLCGKLGAECYDIVHTAEGKFSVVHPDSSVSSLTFNRCEDAVLTSAFQHRGDE